MALRVQMGNRPVLDDDGFVHGVLKTIGEEEVIPEREWESVRWEFESQGTIRPLIFRVWSGLKLNPADDKGELNRLTLLCLHLGAVTPEQLDSGQDPELDLESLVGLCVKFKLVKEGGLYRLDVNSLSLEASQPELL